MSRIPHGTRASQRRARDAKHIFSVQWCDRPVPWLGCVSCRTCVHDVSEGNDEQFACKCRAFRADRRDGRKCKGRRGCVCRRTPLPDEVLERDDGTDPYDIDCERAVRASRECKHALRRRQWRPSGASTIRRVPHTGVTSAPPRTSPRDPGASEPFRGAQPSSRQGRFSGTGDPYGFSRGLITLEAPTGNGLVTF